MTHEAIVGIEGRKTHRVLRLKIHFLERPHQLSVSSRGPRGNLPCHRRHRVLCQCVVESLSLARAGTSRRVAGRRVRNWYYCGGSKIAKFSAIDRRLNVRSGSFCIEGLEHWAKNKNMYSRSAPTTRTYGERCGRLR